MHTHTSVATIRFKQLLELLRPQTSICDPQNIHPLIMAAMFCCASSRAMRGWVQAFKCFGVTLAYQGADEHQGEELILRAEGPQQVPQGPRRGQEPPAPDCINPCPMLLLHLGPQGWTRSSVVRLALELSPSSSYPTLAIRL